MNNEGIMQHHPCELVIYKRHASNNSCLTSASCWFDNEECPHSSAEIVADKCLGVREAWLATASRNCSATILGTTLEDERYEAHRVTHKQGGTASVLQKSPPRCAATATNAAGVKGPKKMLPSVLNDNLRASAAAATNIQHPESQRPNGSCSVQEHQLHPLFQTFTRHTDLSGFGVAPCTLFPNFLCLR